MRWAVESEFVGPEQEAEQVKALRIAVERGHSGNATVLDAWPLRGYATSAGRAW